ncbi:hypothetical protein SH467x_001247 [Pirellulaceae bacterium SH467]
MNTKMAGKIILGMIENGTYQCPYAEELREIIEEWQGYTSLFDRMDAQQESSFVASLSPNERIAYSVVCNHTTTEFELLHREWPSQVTDDAIKKVLKGLRKKVRTIGYDFIISGAHRHVTWKDRSE